MSWCDYDFLGSGVEKARDALSERLRKLIDALPEDCDTSPAIEAIYGLIEGDLEVANNDSEDMDVRMAAAERAASDIEALDDSVLSWVQKSLIASHLQLAVINERRNNDPERPFEILR